jgi:hypothetical protein
LRKRPQGIRIQTLRNFKLRHYRAARRLSLPSRETLQQEIEILQRRVLNDYAAAAPVVLDLRLQTEVDARSWTAQQVGGSQHAGRRIDFHTLILESQLDQQSAGARVAWKMTREQAGDSKSRESMSDHCPGGFKTDSQTPVLWSQMESEFENAGPGIVRPQTAASDMSIPMQEEQRPVLDIVFTLEGDLRFEARADLLSGEWAPDKLRNARVAPELQRQGKIVFSPAAKADPLACQKIPLLVRHFDSVGPRSSHDN